jgi:hypothetical protein
LRKRGFRVAGEADPRALPSKNASKPAARRATGRARPLGGGSTVEMPIGILIVPKREGMIQCFQLLADMPRLGRKADQLSPGARRREHARHVIFYEEEPDGVLIIGIVHERSIRTLRDAPE